MILKNRLKKDWLLLKKEREENYIDYQNYLEKEVPRESFDLISFELANMLWVRLQSLNLESKGKLIENSSRYFDINENFELFFQNMFNKFTLNKSQKVYVLPFNWQKTGGLIIDSYSLIKKLDKILYIYDDDIGIYSENFVDCLMFSGDRRGNNLRFLEVLVKGKNWKNLV